jgi:hypothetical protein
MPRRGNSVRCQKSGKVRFRTWEKATSVGHRVDGSNVRAYWCSSCGGYHITGAEKRKG